MRELLKPVFAQASANYPESLWKLYIINAPYLFRSLWGVIRMWLDPMTQKKIHILGGKSQYQKELERSGFALDQLPVWCGGTHPGEDVYELCRQHLKKPIFVPGPMSNCFQPLVAGQERAVRKRFDKFRSGSRQGTHAPMARHAAPGSISGEGGIDKQQQIQQMLQTQQDQAGLGEEGESVLVYLMYFLLATFLLAGICFLVASER